MTNELSEEHFLNQAKLLFHEVLTSHTNCQSVSKIQCALMESFELGQQSSEWISVDERLPDDDPEYPSESVPVIGCWEISGKREVGEVYHDRCQHKKVWRLLSEESVPVICWKPLPKPPQSEEG